MPAASSSLKVRRRPTSFSTEFPRVDIIFNSVSGTRDPKVDLKIIKAALEKSFDTIIVWNTTPEKDGELMGREALDDGAHVLVACGGDGTVTGVASAIKRQMREGQPIPVLGVVPRGTANAICAALDIPSSVKQAAEMIATGHVRSIDFPSIVHSDEATPKSMLLLCGVGLEAETVKTADRGMKRAIGVLAYAFAGIRSTWRQTCFRTDLVLYGVEDSLMFAGGTTKSDEVHLTNMKLKGVTIANVAPATSVLAQGIGTVTPDDGLLEVVCISSKTPLGMIGTMLSMLRSALMRTRERRGNVYGLRAKKVDIVCNPPQHIVIDGEDAGLTPITVAMDETLRSVSIIAPKAGTVNRRRKRLGRSLVRLWRNARGIALFALTIAFMKKKKSEKSAGSSEGLA